MHRYLVAGFLLAGALAACDDTKKQEAAPTAAAPGERAVTKDDLALFGKLPDKQAESPDNPITEEKVALGRMLFFDPRLSKSQKISCNTCHGLDKYGVDQLRVSKGHQDQVGTRNSPTVYNAAILGSQFWDGRAPTVEAQAQMPITNPVEMAMPPDGALVVEVLSSIPEYVEAFEKVFPGEAPAITMANVGKAIGAFERRLLTPSPFDAFLAGDDTALSAEQKKGLVTFIDVGCATCHNGAGVGGSLMQKLGSVKPWPDTSDQGKFEETKNEADKMIFRTASLRNVEKTAPYFHDGKTAKLEDAVEKMAWHQLGRKLEPVQTASIVAFLKSLTGKLPPKELIEKPELPPITPKTPPPQE